MRNSWTRCFYLVNVQLCVVVVGGHDGLLELNVSGVTLDGLLEMNEVNGSGLTNVLPIDG